MGTTAAAAAPHVGTTEAPSSTLVLEAISGLRNLGCREIEARRAVEAAVATFVGPPTVEALIVAALKPQGAALLAREPAARYGTAHVGSEPSVCRESEALYGAADLPIWLQDFLRRAMAGNRSITVRLRRSIPP